MKKTKRLVKTISLPNGKRKYIYGKTKEELEQKYIQAKLELCAGVDLSNKTTFGEFAQLWFNTYKKDKVSESRARDIKKALNVHIMPYMSGIEMKKITPMMCARIFTEMDKKNLSNGTQKVAYNIMKNIFQVAADNGIIAKTPMTSSVTCGGRPAKKKEALSDATVKSLLTEIKNKNMEDEMFCIIALNTGMRIGEILCLRWDDIDKENREIHVSATALWVDRVKGVRSEHPKTAAGNRVIPYGDAVAKALTMLELKGDSEWVFSYKGDIYSFSRIHKLRKSIHDCGGVSPHVLRHTAITKWYRAGMSIKECQYLAGHATSAITMDVYNSYVKEDEFEETANKIRSIG